MLESKAFLMAHDFVIRISRLRAGVFALQMCRFRQSPRAACKDCIQLDAGSGRGRRWPGQASEGHLRELTWA